MSASTITLTLTVDEVNGILNVLGELPSKTGAWPLIRRIREQAESQVNAATATEREPKLEA